ncbi:N-acetylmuramoyl-L-alanine amidase [Pseudorhodobacter sp.]|uniref:N-acetylmuramoyl-L-alanine amidase n=1 Tax=Pseudorhodobacter sp. TaxID=1934400 RepID=UPI00264884C0|nr:N-acetylmuramoyl-L-alanine amidase [Pseudorhodobacter sp.]MDN5785731.1 N-acetylmuramoyl-L-alanine amidase [Pseudorhodobacter sp.]
MSKAAISMIQSGLRDLGFAPGPTDGLYGAKTRAAALAWLDAGGAQADASLMPMGSAMIYQGSQKYPVHEIVVHCSATRPDWMKSASFAEQVAEIRRWHVQDRGWNDIGYHWLISRSGQVLMGRPENVIGAGVAGHNSGVIHVCLLGGAGSAETDHFSDHFTSSQNITLRQVLDGIGMRTQIRRISGHNEYAAKACPGFTVSQWLKEAH